MALTIRQIIVDWATVAGSGFVSVLYFTSGNAVEDQRDALDEFLTDVCGALTDTTTYTIRTDGVDIDDGDGTLVASWADSRIKTNSGDQSTEGVPDAVQMLFRWKKDVVVGTRFLQGRTFVPGLAAANVVDGNLSAAAVAAMQGFINSFLASPQGFGIWSRPVKDDDGNITRAGSFHEDTTGSPWPELAVLRRRRQ